MVYVRKAFHYLGLPLNWDTPAVENAVAPVMLVGSGGFCFPNFPRSDFTARVQPKETRDCPFAHIPFVSFLYALRAPSDDLILKMAFAMTT